MRMLFLHESIIIKHITFFTRKDVKAILPKVTDSAKNMLHIHIFQHFVLMFLLFLNVLRFLVNAVWI